MPELSGGALLEQRIALEPSLGSPREARVALRALLIEAGHEDWVDAGVLAISEVVTNGALHARTAMEVRVVAYADRACVEVRDFDSTMPVRRDYDVEATTGRGMGLVSTLAASCGVASLGERGRSSGSASGRATSIRSTSPLLASARWTAPTTAPPAARWSFPATLWLSARQHHDAILRELVLYDAERGGKRDLAAADRARAAISGAVLQAVEDAHAKGMTRPVLPDGHPSPLPWVPEQLDLYVAVDPHAAGDFAALQDVLDAAERLAVAGELLCRPGLPEVVAVRDWACEQVIAQIAGIPPAPWPGTAQERFEVDVRDRSIEMPAWDSVPVTNSDRGVIAADDANRIMAISRPLASMLGWDAAELIGRRVVTVIPPSLRGAHVAGFSRHLTTGEAHVLGVPLTLPVLCKDGSERECRFLIETAPAELGRSIYLAWIEPIEPRP